MPSEVEHARCERVIGPLPFTATITPAVLDSDNSVYKRAQMINGAKGLWYGSDEDILYFVRCFLEDILFALDMRFTFNSVMTIKEIRPDLRVLMIGNYVVGVVAVKTPGYDVLLEDTVLGELLDQMLLVEGFYRMGLVIGILTTAEE